MTNPDQLDIRVLIADALVVQGKLLPDGERLPNECINAATSVTAIIRGLPADLTRAGVVRQMLGLGIVAQPFQELNVYNKGPKRLVAVESWAHGDPS